MKPKYFQAIFIILLMALSTYLTAAAMAESQASNYGPLTIYHLDSSGNLAPASNNLFGSGEQIWIAVPLGDSSPFWLTVYDDRGSVIWNQEGAIPSNNLLPLALSPSLLPPNHNYQVILKAMQETLPGTAVVQSYLAMFLVIPGFAHLQLESFSRNNNGADARVRLLDTNNNPKTGVRIGLVLRQSGSALPVTTETTDTQGRARFQFGEALASGRYALEVRVLDGPMYVSPLRVSDFTVDTKPTRVVASLTLDSLKASLLDAQSQAPIQGRLLLLEQQLSDGNWTISATAYTDGSGQAFFVPPSGSDAWRVSFKGDTFYSPSSSDSPSTSSSSSSSPATTLRRVYSYVGSYSTINAATAAVTTTTSLYLPSTAYATIPAVLTAQVRDNSGIPVTSVTVWFYKDGSSIGTSTTNSTGFAAFVWTANVTGTHNMQAAFLGNAAYQASISAQQSFAISQTPTSIMILKPQTIAYSWDLYSYYNGNGRPIVVPIVTLTLAASNNSNPANIYIPPYSGNSTTPPHISGYGWAGLNQSSAVTVTFNATYTQTQSMNWTRNFFLPPCPTPPSCSTTQRNGHIYLSASLAPPSTLYTSSSTTLNIPYQNVNSLSSASSQLTQDATPPSHLYVKVNATYPYISLNMQGTPVALEAYVAWLAYTLGPPVSSVVNCPNRGSCYNYFTLPFASSTQGSDFAYACMSTGCSTPAANALINLYNRKGQLCLSTTTDNRGIAQLNFAGTKTCTYPYYYLGTSSTQVILSELFAVEAVSKPYPFYTNFQGYNYAIYAPQRATRYLLSLHTYYQASTFTVLYPATSYPDVQPGYASCCDVFLTVEKHPVKVNIRISPITPTIVDSVNATIGLMDQSMNKPMANTSFNYSLVRSDPGPSTVLTGSLTTTIDGTVALSLGKLSYGNYTLAITRNSNSTISAVSYLFNFTIYKARTILVISSGWIQNAVVGQTYLFGTSIVDNATQSMINVSGLVEQVYVNDVLYSQTWLCTSSGCSRANYYLTNPGGNVTFPWTPTSAGEYKIEVRFSKQNYYTATSTSMLVSVARRGVVLALNGSPAAPEVGQQVSWDIFGYDMINNVTLKSLSVGLYINGGLASTISTDAAGNAVFTYSFSSRGSYNVTFISAANQTYDAATVYRPLTVFVKTILTLGGGTILLGQQNTLSVSLKDAGGVPLAGRVVRIEIGGKSYSNVTADANGQAVITWRPDATGNYTIVARYSPAGTADIGYESSSSSIIVNVAPLASVNTDSTTAGTQTVSLGTAQGSAQPALPAPSISIQFPSLGSVVVTIQLNGKTVQASIHTWNEFGWTCAAKVNTFFGSVCVLWVPFWRLHSDLSVGGSFLGIYLNMFGLDGGISLGLQSIPAPDTNALILGLATGGAMAVGAILLILAGGPVVGGAAAAAAIIATTLVATYVGLRASNDVHWRLGYFLGLFAALLAFLAAIFIFSSPSLVAFITSKLSSTGVSSPYIPIALLVITALAYVMDILSSVPPMKAVVAGSVAISIAISLVGLLLGIQ